MKHSRLTVPGILAVATLTVACAAPSADTGGVSTNSMPVAPAQAATQWVITCQPYQQAEIRNVLRDGVPIAQVTCVDSLERAVMAGGASSVARAVPVPNGTFGNDIISLDDRLPVQPRPAVRARPAVYTVADQPARPVERVERGRSWKKSAVIIGSSAGVGAGLGAAMGGKKGALIGAAIGGGGAAIWDQMTRNK
jgi:hypothetical protein